MTISTSNVTEIGPFGIYLRDDGMLLVHLKEDYADISLTTMRLLIEAIGKIGNGKKMKVIIDIHSFNTISDEAKKYSATQESQIYTRANAIVIHSLATRLGANFFIRFNKPITPTRVFNTIDEAANWLHGIK